MENKSSTELTLARNEVMSYLDNKQNQELVSRMLGGNNNFSQDLLSLLVNDEKLASCKPQTIIEGALQVKSLGLSFNKAIGDAYLIPYENKKPVKQQNGYTQWVVESMSAQVQISYKGIKKLLMRNPNVESINECFVRDGEIEFSGYEDYEFELKMPPRDKISIKDIDVRNSKPVVGYAVIIKLKDGSDFRKFWSVERCRQHGLKYSKGVKDGEFMPRTQWADNFDNMAMKTVIKQLAKTSGLLGNDEERVIGLDQAVVEGERFEYPDNPNSDNQEIKDVTPVSAPSVEPKKPTNRVKPTFTKQEVVEVETVVDNVKPVNQTFVDDNDDF